MNDNDYFFVDRSAEHKARRERLAQMKEMLWVFFYLWYGVEYLLIRLFHKKQNCAYHDISLEEEAHNNDENPDYLKTRKHYAWWKYIRLRSNHK